MKEGNYSDHISHKPGRTLCSTCNPYQDDFNCRVGEASSIGCEMPSGLDVGFASPGAIHEQLRRRHRDR
jgi:hypothetical protein